MTDEINKIVAPFIPVERGHERRDNRDKRNYDFRRTPGQAKEKKEESSRPAPTEQGEKGKGGFVDIKA